MGGDGVIEVDTDLEARLKSIVEERVTSAKCPSIVATVFQGSNILMHTGVGERVLGQGAPNDRSAYRIASCSKSFTVAMLLILRDRGLLDLDAPITDFVKEFIPARVAAAYGPPTVRMLMSMSGGLSTDDPWADRQESISDSALRDIVARGVLLTTAPGTTFQYSNLGYALLGQVVQEVTAKGFRDLVNEEILRPLGLHDTGYEMDVVERERLVRGYRRRGDEWIELPFSGPGAFSCIGGLFSSARDLSTWVRWLSSAIGDEPDESGPLSVSSRREMQQAATIIPRGSDAAALATHAHRSFGYAFGLISEYDETWGQFVSHSGGYPGFSSHMRWHAATGLGVVVLENATYSGATQTGARLMDEVLEGAGVHETGVEPWARTSELAREATSLIERWDDQLATRIFEDNVALDVPLDERRAEIARLIDVVGGLEPTEPGLGNGSSATPLHRAWTLRGHRGSLNCVIRLSPTLPSLIQTFQVTLAEAQ